MAILRSFDVNKPGTTPHKLRGGVLGGSILRGVLQLGEKVEIRPGVVTVKPGGGFLCKPIVSTVTSLRAEENSLEYAVPGGLIGVGTTVDPAFCRGNRLVGQVLGRRAAMPDVFQELEVQYKKLGRVLGAVPALGEEGEKVSARAAAVGKLGKGEPLMVTIGTTSCKATVIERSKREGVKLVRLRLAAPVCTVVGEKVALSRSIENHWRLIGCGELRAGVPVEFEDQDGAPAPTSVLAPAAADETTPAPVEGLGTCKVKVELKASPAFVLSATSPDPDTAMNALQSSIEDIQAAIARAGGQCIVKVAPAMVRSEAKGK